MTSFPALVGLTSYAAPADTNNLTFTLPTGIQRHDLAVVFDVHQDDGGGLVEDYSHNGLRGWTRIWHRNTEGTICAKCYVRPMIGTESGLVVTAQSKNNSGHCTVATVWRGADMYTGPHCGAGAGADAGSNPNAPTRTAPWGSDKNIWLAFAGALNASNAFTGTPVDGDAVSYLSNTLLQSATTNFCSGAFAYTPREAATEDPSGWTKPATNWSANTVVVRPDQGTSGAGIRHWSCQSMDSSLANDDVTVHIEGGPHTRLLLLINAQDQATADTPITVTLDPSGANITMTRVQNPGGTIAEEDGSTTAGVGNGMIWYTTTAAQALSGDYVVRFTAGGYTSAFHTVMWYEIENTPDSAAAVLDVVNLRDTTADGASTGSINGEDGGLILVAMMPVIVPNSYVHTIGGARAMGYGSSINFSVRCEVYAGRAVAGANALDFSYPSSANVLHYTAISLGFVPSGGNACHHGSL